MKEENKIRDKQKILIYGSGGHGKIVLDIFNFLDKRVIGFIDDKIENHNKKINGYPILGGYEVIGKLFNTNKANSIIVAIGDNKIRRKIFERCLKDGYNIINAIHPKTIISKNTKIGKGVVIVAGVIINTDSKIGDNVIINTGSTIDHDNNIEDNVQICPGCHLAGSVKVFNGSFLGTGVVVNPNIKIGKDSIIGSGSVVINNIPSGVTAVGVPCKVIKENKNN